MLHKFSITSGLTSTEVQVKHRQVLHLRLSYSPC